MKSNRVLLLALFSLTLARAEAPPGRGSSVADLASAADIVVLGRIASPFQVGVATLEVSSEKVPSRVMVAELHVQEVFKGAPGISDITIRFLLPDLPIGYASPPVGGSAIFFLNQTDGQYSLTSPYEPFLVGIPGATPEGGTLVDRLTACVGAVIESTETSSDQKREAIRGLFLIPGDLSTRALQVASHLADRTLRLSAIAVLLVRNDISGLQLAAEALLRPAEELPYGVRQNLTSGIGQLEDGQAVPTLATLLKQGDDPVRRAAAFALMRTASPSAVGPLAEALDDRDYQVRYYAVTGLAEITGQNNWRPSTDDFRDRGDSYLSHWKEWKRGR